MSEKNLNMQQGNSPQDLGYSEWSMLDAILLLLKYRKSIALIVVVATMVAVVVSLLLTPIYRATTTILPPQSSDFSMASKLFAAAGPASSALAGMGAATSIEMYVDMLKSRTVLDGLIEQFNLRKVYKGKPYKDLRKLLTGSIEINANRKSGVITISVENPDPKLAAQLANGLVNQLQNLTKSLAVTQAGRKRLFFERQLADQKDVLVKAESNMKQFQEKTGVIQLESQAKSVLEGISFLRNQIAAKEVKLRVMSVYSTVRNPDVQLAKEEVGALRNQLKALASKGGGDKNPDTGGMLSTRQLPSVGLSYIRFSRELAYHQALYEILLKQFEVAKLEEAQEATLIQVIDRAIPPDTRIKPQRSKIVMLGFALGLCFSCFLVIALDKLSHFYKSAEISKRIAKSLG